MVKLTRYNIVTGWRRGATSATMSALRQCGIPIIGYKFGLRLKDSVPTDTKVDVGVFKLPERATEDNPTGYWEMPSVCLGKGLTKSWDKVGVGGELFKVPFDVLTKSNPKMIDKVIVILRNPRSVIRSRINSPTVETDNKRTIRIAALGLLHNAVLSFRWLKTNKIPHRVVIYENLLKNPEKELGTLCRFLERGDEEYGAKAIQKKLNKSKPIKYNLEELKMVEEFYNSVKEDNSHKYYDLKDLQKRIIKLDKYKIAKFFKS